MPERAAIEDVRDLDAWFDDFLREASQEGVRFVERLSREWRSGENCFSGAGERLIAARMADVAVGICGLNRDQAAPRHHTGRLRHLYVRPRWRRRGVARILVEELLTFARASFVRVRLRTDNPAADRFYRSLGFAACDQPLATHLIELRARPRV